MPEHNLQSIAFPTLDEAQISKLAQCTTATPKVYRTGRRSLRSATATSILHRQVGEIEIVDHSGDEPKTVTVHRKGQFTGEITHLTGNPAVVSAIAEATARCIRSRGTLCGGS